MTHNTPDDEVGSDLIRIGSWGEPSEVPSVDQLMMRSLPAAPAQAAGSASWGRWAAVAAAVALIALIATLPGNDGPEVVAGPPFGAAPTTESPGPAATAPGDCAAVQSFAESMRSVAEADGTDPSASVADLAARSAVILRGDLTEIRTDVDEATQRPVIVLSVQVSGVVRNTSEQAIPELTKVNAPWDKVVIDPLTITSPFVPDTPALLFLGPASPSKRRTILPEGFWVSCGDGTPAIAASPESVLWTPGSTLDELTRQAAAAPPPATTNAPSNPVLSESTRQGAESLIRRFIDDVGADRFTDATALWSGYPESLDTQTVHVQQLRSDFAWMFSGAELSFIVNPSWAFTTPMPVVTVIGSSGGAKQAATFVVDGGAGSNQMIQRLPDAAVTLTPPPLTSLSGGDTITFDFVPVEGGAVAFLGLEALAVDIDHTTLTTIVHLPALLPDGDFVITLSTATPELPTGFAFAFRTAD